MSQPLVAFPPIPCNHCPMGEINLRDHVTRSEWTKKNFGKYTHLFLWKRESALGHKFQLFEGTFIHMVWECPKVKLLWSQVTEFMADDLDEMDSQKSVTLLSCLLGAISDEKKNNATERCIRILFFLCAKMNCQNMDLYRDSYSCNVEKTSECTKYGSGGRTLQLLWTSRKVEHPRIWPEELLVEDVLSCWIVWAWVGWKE